MKTIPSSLIARLTKEYQRRMMKYFNYSYCLRLKRDFLTNIRWRFPTTTDERNVIYPLMKIPEKKVLKKSEWERLSKLLTLNNKFQFSLIFLDKIVSGRQYIDVVKAQHILEETFTYQSQELSLIPHSSLRVSIY